MGLVARLCRGRRVHGSGPGERGRREGISLCPRLPSTVVIGVVEDKARDKRGVPGNAKRFIK